MAQVTCQTGCDDDLPSVSFNDDCGSEVHQSEIETLFVSKAGSIAFTDWTDPAEWSTRLSQTANLTGNEIRALTVIGDKPAAQASVVNISKERTKKVTATHVINFEIDDLTQQNYEFALKMQCGVRKRFWYKTRGGKQYGGNAGILATIELNPVLGRGDEIEKLVGTITWKSKLDPERADAVI